MIVCECGWWDCDRTSCNDADEHGNFSLLKGMFSVSASCNVWSGVLVESDAVIGYEYVGLAWRGLWWLARCM